MGMPVFMDSLLSYVQGLAILTTVEGDGDGFAGAGEKNPAGKSDLRVSCDSMSCIRFDGYNLSPAILAEHPNRNQPLLMSSDEKSNFFMSLRTTVFLQPHLALELKGKTRAKCPAGSGRKAES